MAPQSQGDPDQADLLLVNPAAGGGRARDALPSLRAFIAKRKWQVEICVTESREDLAKQAKEAAKNGCKRIFVLGGDGTFQVLINALIQFPEIILGILPAGGGNDLAAALGLPLDPVRAAEMLLAGEPAFLDAARARTSDGIERLYIGGGGVGLDAEAALYAGGVYRNLRGRLRYLLSALRALIGFHPIKLRVRAEGSELENRDVTVLLLGILNTPSYGAGLRLAPDARIDDGKLDLVLLEDLSFLEILALLPALASRGELQTKRVQRTRVERVRIETEQPCRFHGDGEILGSTPIEIEVVSRAIRVLRPAKVPPRE